MGYKPVAQLLDLPDFRGDDSGDDLVVRVIAPSVREAADINFGRREDDENDSYTRRAFGYLVPKIRFWNLETEDGEPVPLPRDVALDEPDPVKRLELQLDHLYDQDENVVIAIYQEWRMVGMPKKREDGDEGKENTTPSTPGPDASPPLSIRELESQIPM